MVIPMIIGGLPQSGVKQIFSCFDWDFEGFELIFDKSEKSILFDWEDGMANHVFGFARKGFDKLQLGVDYACFKTLGLSKRKKVTMVSQTQSQVFPTKNFDIDTYKTLISGQSITMLPMCNLFMVGSKV